MPKEFLIKAGETRRVLWVYSSSISGSPRFTAETLDGNEVSGTVEIARKRWFTWHRDMRDLQARNVFDKGISDGDYRIFVTPDHDTRIKFETRHFRAEIFFKIFAGIIILGLISASAAWIFADPGIPSQK